MSGTGRKLPAFDPEPSGRFAHRVLSDVGASGALIGRLAVWAWVPDPSQHEFTKDLDVAVSREHLPLIREWFARQGLRVSELSIGGINYHRKESGINVDFIERSGRGDPSALFDEAIAAARDAGQTVDVGGGIELPVVRAEHLVAMKLGTGEAKDERDVVRLLEAVREIDPTLLRELVRRHLGVGSLNRLEVILRDMGHPGAIEEKRYLFS